MGATGISDLWWTVRGTDDSLGLRLASAVGVGQFGKTEPSTSGIAAISESVVSELSCIIGNPAGVHTASLIYWCEEVSPNNAHRLELDPKSTKKTIPGSGDAICKNPQNGKKSV